MPSVGHTGAGSVKQLGSPLTIEPSKLPPFTGAPSISSDFCLLYKKTQAVGELK